MTERREILRGEPEHEPVESLAVVMRELLLRLRRRADRQIAHALVIAIDLEAGYRPAEIRERHALSLDEYRVAFRLTREELNAMRA